MGVRVPPSAPLIRLRVIRGAIGRLRRSTVALRARSSGTSPPFRTRVQNAEYFEAFSRAGGLDVHRLSTKALVEAVEAGNAQRIELLRREGADPNELHCDFQTPLLAASFAAASSLCGHYSRLEQR